MLTWRSGRNQEVLAEAREWSVVSLGGSEGVERPSRRFCRCRKDITEGRERSKGRPKVLGGVGKHLRRAGRCQEAFPEIRDGS